MFHSRRIPLPPKTVLSPLMHRNLVALPRPFVRVHVHRSIEETTGFSTNQLMNYAGEWGGAPERPFAIGLHGRPGRERVMTVGDLLRTIFPPYREQGVVGRQECRLAPRRPRRGDRDRSSAAGSDEGARLPALDHDCCLLALVEAGVGDFVLVKKHLPPGLAAAERKVHAVVYGEEAKPVLWADYGEHSPVF